MDHDRTHRLEPDCRRILRGAHGGDRRRRAACSSRPATPGLTPRILSGVPLSTEAAPGSR